MLPNYWSFVHDGEVLTELANTRHKEEGVAERMGITIDDIEAIMAEMEFTRCELCDTWTRNDLLIELDDTVNDFRGMVCPECEALDDDTKYDEYHRAH